MDNSSPTQARDAEKEKRSRSAANVSYSMWQSKTNIVDVLRYDLFESDEMIKRSTKQFMKKEGAGALIKLCFEEFGTEEVISQICGLVQLTFQKEFDKLCKSSSLRQPSKACDPEVMSTFSFKTVWATMEATAPNLSNLIRTLVVSGDNPVRTSERVERNKSEDVGSGDRIEEPSDEDSEEEDIGVEPARKADRLKHKAARKSKRQAVILTTVLSSLCYARNQHSNSVQLQMGYYLLSANTPKRVIEVLHQLRISVCYKTILNAMTAISKKACAQLRQIPSKFRRFWVSFDNVDFLTRVRDQRIDHQGALLHHCIGYLAISLIHKDLPTLTVLDVTRSIV